MSDRLINHGELRARGWSKKMCAAFLPDLPPTDAPDFAVQSLCPLYPLRMIEELEAKPEIAERMGRTQRLRELGPNRVRPEGMSKNTWKKGKAKRRQRAVRDVIATTPTRGGAMYARKKW